MFVLDYYNIDSIIARIFCNSDYKNEVNNR